MGEDSDKDATASCDDEDDADASDAAAYTHGPPEQFSSKRRHIYLGIATTDGLASQENTMRVIRSEVVAAMG